MDDVVEDIIQKQTALVIDITMIAYEDAFELQRKLVDYRSRDKIDDTLLLLEHLPVFTANREISFQNILVTGETLEREGIAICRTDRGGDVTYHGPGQIVGYNIMDLKSQGRDLHTYVRNMEQMIIDTLAEYGIESGRDEKYPGVWVGDEKICAIGIAVKKNWISMHGFALNVEPNMEHYGMIVACGIADRGVTSMKALLGNSLDIWEVKERLIQHYGMIFEREPKIITLEDLPWS